MRRPARRPRPSWRRSWRCPSPTIEGALAQVELSGAVLRGQFVSRRPRGAAVVRPPAAGTHEPAHARALRRDIEPVSASDFVRFLLELAARPPGHPARRPRGAARGRSQQLQGFEAAAGAWEQEILPARLADYDPDWLDDLCLGGEVVWGRFEPRAEGTQTPTRAAPIALAAAPRPGLPARAPAADSAWPRGSAPRRPRGARLPHAAGASFLEEIVSGARRLRAEVEEGLWELVAAGRVTADGFAALRALLPSACSARRRQRPAPLVRPLDAPAGPVGHGPMVAAAITAGVAGPAAATDPTAAVIDGPGGPARGCWPASTCALGRRVPGPAAPGAAGAAVARSGPRLPPAGDARASCAAGAWWRASWASSSPRPRRWSRCAAIRRRPQNGEVLALSACDPLNLVGHHHTGHRIPATLANTVVYRDGVPTDETGHEAVVAEINPYPLPRGRVCRRVERPLTPTLPRMGASSPPFASQFASRYAPWPGSGLSGLGAPSGAVPILLRALPMYSWMAESSGAIRAASLVGLRPPVRNSPRFMCGRAQQHVVLGTRAFLAGWRRGPERRRGVVLGVLELRLGPAGQGLDVLRDRPRRPPGTPSRPGPRARPISACCAPGHQRLGLGRIARGRRAPAAFVVGRRRQGARGRGSDGRRPLARSAAGHRLHARHGTP